MGKRSSFQRVERDSYDTPAMAVDPLLPHLPRQPMRFIEPCAGTGLLVQHLTNYGHICVGAHDIVPRGAGIDQLNLFALKVVDVLDVDMAVTNPPWDRAQLHQIILHLRKLRLPSWLLIDANWMFTAQAAPYLLYCERIVTIGRVKWIPGTRMTGKDDAAWFLFQSHPVQTTTFYGKEQQALSGDRRLPQVAA